MSEPALSPAQAAEMIGNGTTEHWLKAKASAKAIPHTRVGGRIGFYLHHIEAIKAMYEVAADSPAPKGLRPTKGSRARRSA